MSLRTEQIAAQKAAFDYAMDNPELHWGRHLIGPCELTYLIQQAGCSEVLDGHKWRKVAKKLAYALSFEAGASEDAAKIRAAALEEFKKLNENGSK